MSQNKTPLSKQGPDDETQSALKKAADRQLRRALSDMSSTKTSWGLEQRKTNLRAAVIHKKTISELFKGPKIKTPAIPLVKEHTELPASLILSIITDAMVDLDTQTKDLNRAERPAARTHLNLSTKNAAGHLDYWLRVAQDIIVRAGLPSATLVMITSSLHTLALRET